MIRIVENSTFVLETKHTSYIFRVLPTGHLEHLYYGRKIRVADEEAFFFDGLAEPHEFMPGNAIAYDNENTKYTLNDIRLEMSAYGKGDVREPFLVLRHADGSATSDFIFDSARIEKGALTLETLPTAYDESGEAERLVVTLKDVNYDLSLQLNYTVYENEDVITRNAILKNTSDTPIVIERLLSNQIDFDTAGYNMAVFTGTWAREMKRTDVPITMGKHMIGSMHGSSSSFANPFTFLYKDGATEDFGEVYGFNLIYSGNHYETAEMTGFGKTRFVQGIQPEGFSWTLLTGEVFEAPEAYMSYSPKGFNGMSQNMHAFIREHIVRGFWKKKERPILLNSWEAAYFNISESKLLKLAKAGKEVGIELFVMDDGWFGERNDDTSSLGDWDPNPKKLPNGLKGLADKIKKLGLQFGIWVEPEMVNVNSKLYKAHPDWTLDIPGKPHSEGRNQRILDYGRSEVQDYIIEKLTSVFSSADISYVKWDMNRTMTDIFSVALPPEKQGEVAHRYMIGLYRVLTELMGRFPQILFEGCSAGGNRFDPGMLCFFPQIWASDDTDAVARVEIETGYSYGYPMSTVSAHVSDTPNHQTLRVTPIETRFNVAAFGVLGYECNLCEMKKEHVAAIKEQIAFYKEWRKTFFFGSFYRRRSTFDSVLHGVSTLQNQPGNEIEWNVVSEDKKTAVSFLMHILTTPNTQFAYIKPAGLDENICYHVTNRKLQYDIRDFGNLVNAVSPIHVKQDSLLLDVIAKKIHLDGEIEDHHMYGDAIMYAGVRLAPGFAGTGYNKNVRPYTDFASRIYTMKQV